MDRTRSASRAAAFAWVAAAYAAALVVAAAVWTLLPPDTPLWQRVASADVAATLAVFAFSAALDNSSVYDAYWSVAPMVIAPALALDDGARAPTERAALAVLAVWLWGARLTWNWARGWEGLGHEDWRYVDLRAKTGRAYWLVSLLGLHLFPTVLVYLGCLALIPALVTGARELNALDGAAFALTSLATALEATADAQLRAFRARGERGAIMAEGLWAWSRHPNYLGEMLFWWGLALFAVASGAFAWWAAAGAVAIHLLFVFISVPMLDRRSLARRPAYREHMAKVPGIFPRPWRSTSLRGASRL